MLLHPSISRGEKASLFWDQKGLVWPQLLSIPACTGHRKPLDQNMNSTTKRNNPRVEVQEIGSHSEYESDIPA